MIWYTYTLKVGLGGELDATNVVQTALSILCSVCKYTATSVTACRELCFLSFCVLLY
jgi:hypothetical protein